MGEQRKINDPALSPETEAFWEATDRGEFLVRHCRQCGQAHWYPRTLCPICASMDTEWRTGSGRGTIYTYSVMRRAGDPFVMAYVRLQEGPLMMTNIVHCDPDALRIGDPVRLVFLRSEGGFNVPFFEPAT